MKVGLIGFSNRNYIPYIEYYEDVFKNKDIKYECIFWDRFTNCNTEKNNNEYTVHITCEPGISKIRKLIPMYKFKKEIERIIKEEQYTHLVILTTVPGFLISKSLLRYFRNKFILDIRDYSYEKYGWYRKIVGELIDNSFFTVISSKGFLKFLPKSNKIIPCHNIGSRFQIFDEANDLAKKKKITIGFVGGVRYFDKNCKLINTFANNKKYHLIYIGRKNLDCDLEGYCKRNNIKNVVFKGEFKNEDKPEIYKEIDFINAIYGNESLEVTTALPNRLYDGILFKKPIIASEGTYLGEVVKKYGLGLTINLETVDINIFENYLNYYEGRKFYENCQKYLEIIKKDQIEFLKNITCFVKC
ncbi:hypothetical protein [uncultured Phascolarctobacterium sp.]|uniref:hypothetical protein n=1 Tax=Phascolarctobacterium sp. TaxID=2049039 RepID=UPI0025E0344F|nr:hypothetical protein [uncultured Phascolarctobacterium sp.]